MPLWALQVIIICWNLFQCRKARIAEMWSCFLAPVKILAAEFRMNWRWERGFYWYQRAGTFYRYNSPVDYEGVDEVVQIFGRKTRCKPWNISEMMKAGLNHWFNTEVLSKLRFWSKIKSALLSYWMGQWTKTIWYLGICTNFTYDQYPCLISI